jgi:hypothetical protein
VRRFVSHKELWMGAVGAVAELDALMSLAAAALNGDGPMCRCGGGGGGGGGPGTQRLAPATLACSRRLSAPTAAS